MSPEEEDEEGRSEVDEDVFEVEESREKSCAEVQVPLHRRELISEDSGTFGNENAPLEPRRRSKGGSRGGTRCTGSGCGRRSEARGAATLRLR